MQTVRGLLNKKGTGVWSIGPGATVYHALQELAERNIGALLVTEDERVVGILSERDCVRKLELRGRSAGETTVREIMTSAVVYVRPEQSLEDCMALMTGKRIRHLPVLEGELLIGVISIGDVVKEIISDREFVIEQLENYIRGGR